MKTLKELKASIEAVKDEIDAVGQSMLEEDSDNSTVDYLEDAMGYLDSAAKALKDADES